MTDSQHAAPAQVTETLYREKAVNNLMGTREQTHRRGRLTAVVIAVLVPLAIWAVAEVVFHIRLRTPGGFGPPGDIGALNVIAASALFSLAGWGLLALLERLTARARGVWMTIALVTLLLSLLTPLSGTGITPANRAVLVLMHLAVGAVLIPAFLSDLATNEVRHEMRKRLAAITRLVNELGHGPSRSPHGR